MVKRYINYIAIQYTLGVEYFMDYKNTEARDREILEQVKKKAQDILQRYDFDASDPLQQKATKTLNRVLRQSKASLDTYGLFHETDKASFLIQNNILRLPHDYLRHYEAFLKDFRNDDIVIVEFGCETGASLRMWEDYFPKATIYGVDIVTTAQQYVTERINIVIGNAVHSDTFEAIEEDLQGKQPAIIIDDASHAWSEQRTTLMMFWQMLAPGGIYIIEDLECGTQGAYKEYKPSVEDAQPFFDFIQDRCRVLRWPREEAGSNERTHRQLPQLVQAIEEELDMCYFAPGTIILRKGMTD